MNGKAIHVCVLAAPYLYSTSPMTLVLGRELRIYTSNLKSLAALSSTSPLVCLYSSSVVDPAWPPILVAIPADECRQGPLPMYSDYPFW